MFTIALHPQQQHYTTRLGLLTRYSEAASRVIIDIKHNRIVFKLLQNCGGGERQETLDRKKLGLVLTLSVQVISTSRLTSSINIASTTLHQQTLLHLEL